MSESGQAPEPAEDGSKLAQDTVEGRKVSFVQESTFGTGNLNLAASGIGKFSINLEIKHPPDVGPLVDWDHIVAWNYVNFYVDDTDMNPTNVWRGGTLTIEQKSIHLDSFDVIFGEYDADDIYSAQKMYFFFNFGADPHTVTVKTLWKFVEMA